MNSATQGKDDYFWRTTLLSLAGPLVWAVHFALVYGAHHVLCKTGAQGGTVFWFVIVVSVLAIILLTTLAISRGRLLHYFSVAGRTPHMLNFLVGTTRLLLVLSLAGIVWAATAVLFLPECTNAPDTQASATTPSAICELSDRADDPHLLQTGTFYISAL